MICGQLRDFEDLGLDACGAAAVRAVAWIRSLPPEPKEGSFDIGDGMRALILRYATVIESSARFETHRRHVDLQYTLAGGEVIEWCPRGLLKPFGDYDETRDLIFYDSRSPAGRVVAEPGIFSLFTPLDAHRGGVRIDSATVEVLKLVVKIPVKDFLIPRFP
ncbi:MAG: YhcH/YjgK/YiaL family protein [Opitutaceae bacterium]|nr:YhcH/YjgK/YiaL family protein [Opitutaceae bacterium]